MRLNSLLLVRWCFVIALISAQAFSAIAQTTFPVNGVHEKQDQYILFTNAVVHVSPTETLENGCLLIKDDRIVAVGTSCNAPKNTVTIDVKGHHIYPAFIDLFAEYGLEKTKPENSKNRYYSSKNGAYYWNESIHPEVTAQDLFTPDEKQTELLRSMGFGAVVTHLHDGIARGTGALVQLNAAPTNEQFLIGNAATFYSFKKGSAQQNYPSSQMGAIALIRQAQYDAQWYAGQPSPKKEYNLSLEAFNQHKDLPIIFDADNYRVALRSNFMAQEFSKTLLIKAGGDEYRRLEEIKALNAKWILPLTFPKAFDVEDPLDALHINLEELKHWELAPYNTHYFEKENIPFALTAYGLKTKDEFFGNLRRAIRAGLSEKTALQALTQNPAQWMGMGKELGDLAAGKLANFFISSNNIFQNKALILSSWVAGKPLELKAFPTANLVGKYSLSIDGGTVIPFEISDGPAGLAVKSEKEKSKWAIEEENGLISLTAVVDTKTTLLTGYITNTGDLAGKLRLENGTWANWVAAKEEGKTEDSTEVAKKDSTEIGIGAINYPLGAYGFKEKPKVQNIIIQHATVWTSDEQGVLEDATVILKNGKIAAVGKNESEAALKAKTTGDWLLINGTGMHVTAGIIDEHSHIAIESGVNEGTQSSSAEVRIGDVLNSDDINIYRQLSGGVVAAQLLHGSSNPIGGQSAIIKLRWGFAPEELKIAGADGFIKFALGENVKRSNSYDRYRFPQTRMGVEQTMVDAFTRALEYKKQWNAYLQTAAKQRASLPTPRKDLELEALLEVIESKRFITCHSYVQSEITMLMQVADSFHFKVNTFTHILEGYKVADKMKAHGVTASTFSDWWGYKFEVNDAIPYNASLLNQMGVTTAINSDDAEMARRLNQEAAKGLKYGGMTEIEALNMVTINPAKMLHLDKTMGSLTVGKDADVVVWSAHPLSVYAKVNYTIVDGMVLYDASKSDQLQAEIEAERKRIIEKMIWAKKNKMPVEKHTSPLSPDYECETMIDYE